MYVLSLRYCPHTLTWTQKKTLINIPALPNTRTLYITNLIVPSFVDVKDIAMLTCSYDIGKQKLNSVKWYKNDKEFYRWEKKISVRHCVPYQLTALLRNICAPCKCAIFYKKRGMHETNCRWIYCLCVFTYFLNLKVYVENFHKIHYAKLFLPHPLISDISHNEEETNINF